MANFITTTDVITDATTEPVQGATSDVATGVPETVPAVQAPAKAHPKHPGRVAHGKRLAELNRQRRIAAKAQAEQAAVAERNVEQQESMLMPIVVLGVAVVSATWWWLRKTDRVQSYRTLG